jgi:thioredoxin reductase
VLTCHPRAYLTVVSRKRQHLLVAGALGSTVAVMSQHDVVIIGGGAAGLSAALVLARARRRVSVIDAGEPRNGPAARMHGYLSRDGFAPAQLLSAGRREVEGYGGEIIAATVRDVTPDGADGFTVGIVGGDRISARRVLVATGLRDELPDIPQLRSRWARDVLHCPYCHGHEVRDRPLGVLGGSPGAVRYAQTVRQWSRDLVLFARSSTLTSAERESLDARGIRVADGAVQELVIEDDRLHGVRMEGGRVVACEALFVPPRFVANSQVLLRLGCALDADGWVTTDSMGRTSVAGVWAAGNVVDPRAQVITSAGAGSAAAIGINAELVEEDVRDAVRDSLSAPTPKGAS